MGAPLVPFYLPSDYARIKPVHSFDELASAPWADGVNALCWERTLPGDFAQVVAALGGGEGIDRLDAARLRALRVDRAGRAAIEVLLEDLRQLEARDFAPELNCIHAYPRDDDPGPVPTHVFSFHADSAPLPTSTWLCTYHGAPSEGLRDDHARRHIDDPATRAELLAHFGGADGSAFAEYLADHCYDLHYAPVPGSQPFSFGIGHLWRIAVAYPDCPVPPCVHRAPATVPGQPRLLLIS